MVAIAIYPASGSIIVKETACRITVTAAPSNDPSTFNANNSPSMTQKTYHLQAEHSGADNLVSHVFSPDAGEGTAPTGAHVWDNVVFPYHGSWTIKLIDEADDSTDATLAVSVIT